MTAPADAKLKILLAIESTSGGSARHVLDLAGGLLDAGHGVHIVYSSLRADKWFLEELATLKGVQTHIVDMHRNPGPGDIAALRSLRRIMRSAGPFDVVHGHSSKAGALVRLAGLGFGSPRVYTPHAFVTLDPELSWAKRLVFTTAEFFLQFFGQGVICVSDEEQKHARTLGIWSKLLFTVENGLAAMPPADRAAARKELGLDESDICFGFVGRISGQKPVERLVRAYQSIGSAHPRMVITIIGDGPDYAHVRGLTESLHISDRVRMPGSADGKFLMAGFDAFVLPSRYEGFPYVFLEALARGLPILTTDVGGASSVVDEGRNGYIIPQKQLDLLAARMGELVENPQILARMGQRSLEKSRQFTVANMVTNTLAVYRQLIDD
jgi:glycosyltransferase involved in cell wall biosynthesis